MSGHLVKFSSTSDVLEGDHGHAGVDSLDGLINNITITVPGFAFTQIRFNPTGERGTPLTISATDTDGEIFKNSFVLEPGQNFKTLTAMDGEHIHSVTIISTAGFPDLRQIRFLNTPGAFVPETVPEPGTLEGLLLGIGVIGLAGMTRRKRTVTPDLATCC